MRPVSGTIIVVVAFLAAAPAHRIGSQAAGRAKTPVNPRLRQ